MRIYAPFHYQTVLCCRTAGENIHRFQKSYVFNVRSKKKKRQGRKNGRKEGTMKGGRETKRDDGREKREKGREGEKIWIKKMREKKEEGGERNETGKFIK